MGDRRYPGDGVCGRACAAGIDIEPRFARKDRSRRWDSDGYL